MSQALRTHPLTTMPSFSPSPPASPSQTQHYADHEAQLDSDILHIRAEIAKLRAQKQRLSSALLGSSRIQKQLFARKASRTTPPSDTDAKLESKLTELESKIEIENNTNDIEIHRLAFGVTAFPFTDDAPERRGPDGRAQTMLGLRFDLHPTKTELLAGEHATSTEDANEQVKQDDEAEEEVTTYFLVLRKLQHNNKVYLKVHQHSIPAHIDVDTLAYKYLPLPDTLQSSLENGFHDQEIQEETFQDDSGIDLTQDVETPDRMSPVLQTVPANSLADTGQDTHAFAREVHAHLRAWHYRMQSINLLWHRVLRKPDFTVKDIQWTHDRRSITIAWESDDLALAKVGFDGYVETAVAYGSRDVDEEISEHDDSERDEVQHVRLFTVERYLARTEFGERVRVSKLVERLQAVEKYLAGSA